VWSWVRDKSIGCKDCSPQPYFWHYHSRATRRAQRTRRPDERAVRIVGFTWARRI